MKIIRLILILFLLCSFAYGQQKPDMGIPVDWSNPQTNGLVAWWYMQEGSGNVVGDLSGNGNYGDFVGFDFPPTLGSGWNAGLFGDALTFDGSDYIVIPEVDLLNFDTDVEPFTLCLWVYYPTGSGNDYLLTKAAGDVGFQFTLLADSATGHIIFIVGGTTGGGAAATGTTFIKDAWHHVIGVSDGSNTELYIDGVLDATGAVGGTDAPGVDILVGARRAAGNTGASLLLNGRLDDIRIYDRELLQSEIQDVMNGPPPFLNPFLMIYKASQATTAQVIMIMN